MSSTLWQKVNYSARIEYIIDTTIREFDISKANISILRDANVLTEDIYQYLLNAPRMERQVYIGKLQGSNTEVTNILKNGILNAKKIFMESNGIQDSEVLYIRNDAIAIIGNRYINNLRISDRVSFRESAIYSSFYKFNTIDLLYYFNPVTNTEVLDVKGLGKAGTDVHKSYMLDFLCELFYRAQMEGVKQAIPILQSFHSRYINRDLEVGYYRELNPQSYFKLDSRMAMYSSLYMDHAFEGHKRLLDISYNDNLLRHFIKIYSSIYFNAK